MFTEHVLLNYSNLIKYARRINLVSIEMVVGSCRGNYSHGVLVA